MRRTAVRSLVFLMLASIAGPAPAQTPAEVNASIERGVDYLKNRRGPQGIWDNYGDYDGGTTALAALALLSCDVPGEDLRAALDYLDGVPNTKTYVVALKAMVYAEADPDGRRDKLQQCARFLMDARLANGSWSYGRGGVGDNSNTQYALLGLQACAEAGIDVPDAFWRKCQQYWAGEQAGVGGWGYRGGGTSGSMTAAGVASLIIAGRQYESVRSGRYGGRKVRCDGALIDRSVQAGIGWLGRNFFVATHPNGAANWLYYYLYGLERAGRLSGERFFGNHDWYRAGVRHLTQRAQSANGSWSTGGGGNDVFTTINTSFSLLFLSKGRIPLVINKLKYPGDQWNKAPNDIHNLTRFLARNWKVKLNWQSVDIEQARTVEDLLQAPILHVTGHQAPRFTQREKDLLRQFVEQGGLIMADANCSVEDFTQGFEALCRELFPEPGQELRLLDPGHGVWGSHFRLQPDWPLYGIEVGCRTAVFFSPEDLSCKWEHAREPESTLAMQVGMNIVAYATGPTELKDKLEERKLLQEYDDDEIRRNFLQLAKIKHNGDWNPAPRAIRNLMGELREKIRIDVIAQQREIDAVDPNLLKYPLAYMHGRGAFSLSPQEKDALGRYFAVGGVLFADACCGSPAFDKSFRQLVADLFPDSPMEPIPADHEIYSRAIGYDIAQVEYGAAAGGGVRPPALEGVTVDGRYAIVYTRFDIGCALERQKSSDCKGYTPEAAEKIATNIVLYSLQQ